MEHLAQLMGAYLHQDWPIMYDDWRGAVEDFVSREPSEVGPAIHEIVQLVNSDLTDDDIEKLLGDMGGAYAPDRTIREWLIEVRSHLAALSG